MSLVFMLLPWVFIGGWIFLRKFVQTKAMDQSVEGEKFRTGRPPTWRIILYAVIFMAIPLYFFYPRLNELKPQIRPLIWVLTFAGGGTIIFIGITLPWLVKRNKVWLTEHKNLMLRTLYVIIMLSALLKFWGIFHKE